MIDLLKKKRPSTQEEPENLPGPIQGTDTDEESDRIAYDENLIIQCENLVKIYKTDEVEVIALQGLDLEVKRGEMMAIVGNSGSGKSTLLNMLGGLDKPTAGKLIIDGKNMLKMTEKEYITYKRETVGFVWQNNARNLIPYLTALQNVELPLILDSAKERRRRALELLDMVGLSHRLNNRLDQLSGGEQQRIAIAIALANHPKILLADEPTGAVDSKTADLILDIFKEFNRKLGVTIIIVTHDVKLASKIERVVAIRDGRTSSEVIRRSYKAELEKLDDTALFHEAEEEPEAQEYVVLDKAGRLQIPREYLNQLGIKGGQKVQVECQDGRIFVQLPQDA